MHYVLGLHDHRERRSRQLAESRAVTLAGAAVRAPEGIPRYAVAPRVGVAYAPDDAALPGCTSHGMKVYVVGGTERRVTLFSSSVGLSTSSRLWTVCTATPFAGCAWPLSVPVPLGSRRRPPSEG